MQDKTLLKSLKNVMSEFLNVYKFWIIGLLGCAVVVGTSGPINAYLLSTVMNNFVIHSKNMMFEHVFWPSFLLLLNFLAYDLGLYFWDVINNKIQPEIKARVTLFTYKYILQHSPQFYQKNSLNKILQNINSLANGIHAATNRTFLYLCSSIVTISVALIMLYFVNHIFFTIMASSVTLYGVITYIQYKNTLPLVIDFLGNERAVSALISDGIANSHNIRIYANNKDEVDFLSRELSWVQRSAKQKAAAISKNNFVKKLCCILCVGCVLQVLIHFNALQKISVGQFAIILFLSVRIGAALFSFTENLENMNSAVLDCKSSLETLFAPLDVHDDPQASNLHVIEGNIQFCNVNYNDSDTRFNNLNINIESGQKIGFIGFNSNDKAAFISLIMRMANLSSGTIRIDQQDISAVSQSSIHRAIGYISKNATIFNRTVMENIRYGNKHASDAEVIAAAKQALAHQFIENLPFKYNTTVGDLGVKLTESQRQRIVIARELLKDSPILILDEPILQNDPVLEQREIEDSLWQFMRNKTVLVISNNIVTLSSMDRIMMFEDGQIIEDGTHKRLKIGSDKLYNSLLDDHAFQLFTGF